jgi:hypothetical protein
VKNKDKLKVYNDNSTTGVLKSSVMTLRSGSSAEDVLQTVTSLEMEDGPHLADYVVTAYECWLGSKTGEHNFTCI